MSIYAIQFIKLIGLLESFHKLSQTFFEFVPIITMPQIFAFPLMPLNLIKNSLVLQYFKNRRYEIIKVIILRYNQVLYCDLFIVL
jgi:hypothetical protein